MKFSVGDRVLLKRTGEEGNIVSFLSRQLVEVEVAGTNFPVYLDELEHPYLKWFTERRQVQTEKRERLIPAESPLRKPLRLAQGLYLSFLPQFSQVAADDIIESFRIHLLNETAEHLTFDYHARSAQGITLLQLSGALHPFGSIYLHTLLLEELNAQPRFQWTFAPKGSVHKGISGVVRIRPAQLIRHIASLVDEGLPSFSLLLSQDAEPTPEPLRQPTLPAPQPGNEKVGSDITLHTTAENVVDLHMPAPGPGESVLPIQITLLRKKLQAAYATGLDQITVIHGIGDGVLRDAMHGELRDTPFVSSFSNQWMPGYGWGATKVVFRDQ